MTSAVITGMGTVSACGWGNEALAQAFAEGSVSLGEIDRSSGYHKELADSGRRARPGGFSSLGGVVQGADLTAWLKPAQARRMSGLSRSAVVAAKMAVAAARMAGEAAKTAIEAGAAPESSESSSRGVYLGCAYGPVVNTERILRQIVLEGPTSASPTLFTESVANAPAAQIALQLGLRGPNVTVTQREAGSLIALGLGSAEVRAGRLSRALCGAVDELNPLLHSALDRYRALARPRAGCPERARPFDRRRNGFVIGEGATVVVVEPEQTPGSAGGLARVVLSTSGFDPDAPRAGWSRHPHRLANVLRRGLDRAELAPEGIDLVVSGANGSIPGDRLEALILKELWGDRPLPPVLAPKAVTGEQGGSTLAAAVLALEGRPFGATPGFERVDPELGIAPHRGGELPRPSRVLVTALAVGGAAAWAVLERCGLEDQP